MRLSTVQIFSQGTTNISRTQSELAANQERIASGRRMTNPSDDPVGAAQAVVTSQAKARTQEYGANIGTVSDHLNEVETILADITAEITDIRTIAVNGGAASLSDADRASLATEVEQRLERLVGLANTRGADGKYLFSGFQVDTQPIAKVGTTYAYQGDQGRRTLAVASDRAVALNQLGDRLFMTVPAGNGTFLAKAGAANTGTGLIDGGSVSNPTALDGRDYRIQFNVAGGVTTFDVIDTTAVPAAAVSTGNAYVAGQAITVAGKQVTITGAPAAGDTFSLTTGARQNLFAAVQDLATTLRTPSTGTGGKTAVSNGIGQALQNLSNAQESVLAARAEGGAVLRELDALKASSASLELQYDETLSRLQDLDYNQALSDFARQQLALEAAQKSFLSVTKLSLFNYL